LSTVSRSVLDGIVPVWTETPPTRERSSTTSTDLPSFAAWIAALRPAGREDPLVLGLPLEIVALSGTLSGDGVHLHMAVSDATGAMTGGHLPPGCSIRTTAELVLGLAASVAFRRLPDPATGFPELDFSPTA